MLTRHLTALEDRPWADDAQGHPLTPFRIKAKQIRQGAATRKGYLRSDFTDAFHRYLPADPKHPKHPKHRHGAAELFRLCRFHHCGRNSVATLVEGFQSSKMHLASSRRVHHRCRASEKKS